MSSSSSLNYDIWVMNEDGTGLQNLTQSPGVDGYGRWSPDGRQVVFASNRDGDFDLYVVAADGRGLKKLTDLPGDEIYPDWSPDGKRIVFTTLQSRQKKLVVMKADGTRTRSIVRLGLPTPESGGSAWSPDGKWIAFVKSTDDGDGEPHTGLEDLYLAKPDGTDVRAVAASPLDESLPEWSPDGRWIAFGRETADGAMDIAAVKPDGSGFRWITRTPDHEWNPSWSIDGETIAFVMNKYTPSRNWWIAAEADVWAMDADGSNRARLLLKPDTYEWGIDWRPPGN